MVKVKRGYVIAAFVSSTAALVLSIASISTDYWVNSNLIGEGDTGISQVHYGLFNGIFTESGIVKTHYQITLICYYGENICAWLCEDDPNEYKTQMDLLIENKRNGIVCKTFERNKFARRQLMHRNDARASSSSKGKFLNAGAYLCTIIFLAISIAFGLVSSFLLLWNIVGNPIQTYFSIYSLYYYVALSFIAVLMAVIIWGAVFGSSLIENIAFSYTIVDTMHSTGNPTLGYSYWLNLGATFASLASFALLIARKYLMESENIIKWNIDQGNQVIF